MKKRLLCFAVALACLLMPVLTSCSKKKEAVNTGTKPITITLYGIKGEGTTDEAIKAVQDELNIYSEGNLTTRVLLKLFTEDEYYAKLDAALAEAQKYKDEQSNKKPAADDEEEGKDKEDDKDKDKDKDKDAFPEEQGTQVDIFMVRGSANFQKYYNEGYAVSLALTDKSALMSKYISDRFLALTNTESAGILGIKPAYGIPNNTVYGDYTYLLVNKEVAGKYGYVEKNLDTLPELNNFLADAAKDFGSYVTLYNAPAIDLDNFDGTMFGTIINDTCTAYKKKTPASLLENKTYVEYAKYLNLFESKGYITEGDAYALPEDKKVAAAFIKGNASIPEQYGEDYYVLPYAKPVMEDMGTVFCVSKFAVYPARALEIINLLQTNIDYRNTFQYGVENVHYSVDDYTGIIDIISDDYNMNPADTGNLFLLKENSSMDEATKALCRDNWALGKLQLRETIVAPYTLFNPNMTGLDYDGFKAESESVLSKLMSYKPGTAQTFEEYAAQLNTEFKESAAFKLFADDTLPEPELPEGGEGEAATQAEDTDAEDDVIECILKQYTAWCEDNNVR